MQEIARAQFEAWASGKIDKSAYSIDLPADAVAQLHEILPALGPIQSVALVTHASLPGGSVYIYRFTCKNGSALEQISFKDGKINGIYFKPAP